MKKLIKIAAIGVLILVVLVGVGITILLMNVNSLAKKGIESGGTYALGVETKVSAVRLRLLAELGLCPCPDWMSRTHPASPRRTSWT